MPKISVIVPVFKVEQYLPECLDSISNQTYQDFELILVDDGSPDSCGAMCDDYARNHQNTKVIHQKNAGLSEARNHGVKAASGEYVTFIDSDDVVSPDYLEYLMMLNEKYGTDVSIGNVQKFWDDKLTKTIPLAENDRKVPVSQALTEICYGKISIYACGKLYRRELVEKYPYPAGKLYEDTATTHKIIGEVDEISHGTRVIYYWRQRSGSITHDEITEHHLWGIAAAKEQTTYMQKNYPEVVPAAQARCVMKIIDLSYRLVVGKTDKVLFDRIRTELKPLFMPLLKNKKAGVSLKVRATALYLGYIPYYIICKLYHAVKKNA